MTDDKKLSPFPLIFLGVILGVSCMFFGVNILQRPVEATPPDVTRQEIAKAFQERDAMFARIAAKFEAQDRRLTPIESKLGITPAPEKAKEEIKGR